MHVVATAGHVDHGKSALVRALTGMEPDRWEEERRRGLTLDLGFVWTELPGGGTTAFVDVPGHERLVGNMLAGVGPVPAVLLVVAADQGWQPQSEEHLAVLDALRVRHGVLAVTRSDLADPAPVREDALARIAGTSLGKVEAVAVSSVTGAGLDELRAALVRLTGALPAPDREADVRLWVDRSFTVRGRGTVVTGTLAAGTLRTGDRLELAAASAADGTAVRVRGLQSLKRDRAEAGAVARVAVNVHGVAADAVRRGDALLAPGRWSATALADVRLHGPDDPAAADLPRHLVLHAGSAAVPVTVRPLGPDTVRLTLARPLPLRVGDTALLRDPGRRRIPAGLTVLDVRPPKLARRGAGRARARELETVTGAPDGAAELRRRGLVRRAELLAMGVPAVAEPVAGDWLADPAHWADLRRRLAGAVEEHAARHPMDPGLPVEAARRTLGLPDRALVRALVRTAGGPALEQRDGRLYGRGTRPSLPPKVRAAVDAVRGELDRAPFRAPEAHRLAELGLTPAAVAAAVAAGTLLRIGDGIVLLPGADERAAAVLARLEQPFTTSEARRALDTTRRVAVPLLEHLDARGLTVRLDGTRRRCR
ncbi:selenocysteine-specific translation elongation factor [Streptomyces carminius]|uniref:Selenocysteine-specific translation elongation factor n=1 Tax=Streptomyces carminius TaxID=2665496 RepID=A0A2M8M0V6_9ACTN|nr:SelB C-terminal domain-containing protein [Streptomyces carminius]PJE97843.1 selenocysteine-specific translation elongation factor [Streptomyces carminius]